MVKSKTTSIKIYCKSSKLLTKNKWRNIAQYLTNKILATKGKKLSFEKCKIPPKKKKTAKGANRNVTEKVVTTRGEEREMGCRDMQQSFKE